MAGAVPLFVIENNALALLADLLSGIRSDGFGYVPVRSPPAGPVGVELAVPYTRLTPSKVSTCPAAAPDVVILASASEPLLMFDALSAVNPAPLPVKELPALLNELAPVNVCVPLSNATFDVSRASLIVVEPALTPLMRRLPMPAFAGLIVVALVKPVTSPASVIALIEP